MNNAKMIITIQPCKSEGAKMTGDWNVVGYYEITEDGLICWDIIDNDTQRITEIVAEIEAEYPNAEITIYRDPFKTHRFNKEQRKMLPINNASYQ